MCNVCKITQNRTQIYNWDLALQHKHEGQLKNIYFRTDFYPISKVVHASTWVCDWNLCKALVVYRFVRPTPLLYYQPPPYTLFISIENTLPRLYPPMRLCWILRLLLYAPCRMQCKVIRRKIKIVRFMPGAFIHILSCGEQVNLSSETNENHGGCLPDAIIISTSFP